jgi:hypothetical protein
MFFNQEKKAPHDAAQQVQDANVILERVSPLVKSIYNSKVSFLFGQGVDYISEFIYYILALACFGFLLLMNRIFPFYILGEILEKKVYKDALTSKGDIDAFHLGVKGLVVLVGLLFLIIGIKKRNSRHSRTLLKKSGDELKRIEEYFLSKKTELEKLLPSTNPVPSSTVPNSTTTEDSMPGGNSELGV